MASYLLGLDLGTTNIKGIIMSYDGMVVAEDNTPVTYAKDGDKVEYDADAFYELVCGSIRRMVAQLDKPGDIKAISMVSASGNTLLLDKDMKPLRKAINWTDRRFSNETDTVLKNPDYTNLYKTTGWPFFNTFPIAHISWIRQNEPLALDSANKICMVTDYVNYLLTGELATNPSTATTFYLADQERGTWSGRIVEKLGLGVEKLPKIQSTGTIIGCLGTDAALRTGLPEGVLVIAGSFDHPGAARATGTLEEGDLLLSCGTSWVGFYPCKNRDTLISLSMLVDPFIKDRGVWAGMFSLPRIGDNIDFLIDKWIDCSNDKYGIFNDSAEKSPPGAGGLSINPMEDANKDFSAYGKSEIARALMEGTAALMKDRIEYYKAHGLVGENIVMAGGPTRSKLWMDILCDILGTEITVAGSYAGARGAALIAGIGIGVFRDEIDAFNRTNGGG